VCSPATKRRAPPLRTTPPRPSLTLSHRALLLSRSHARLTSHAAPRANLLCEFREYLTRDPAPRRRAGISRERRRSARPHFLPSPTKNPRGGRLICAADFFAPRIAGGSSGANYARNSDVREKKRDRERERERERGREGERERSEKGKRGSRPILNIYQGDFRTRKNRTTQREGKKSTRRNHSSSLQPTPHAPPAVNRELETWRAGARNNDQSCRW